MIINNKKERFYVKRGIKFSFFCVCVGVKGFGRFLL